MKTFGNLYARICDRDNLYEAARKARRRKTRQEDVERFEMHRERFLRQLHEELTAGSWRPSGYRRFLIHDPKTRTISAAPYRDRVVHHALCNVIGPLLERRLVHDTYSCRAGKGTHAARERCRKYTNRYRYALKCDVRKFFESLDHATLVEKLSHVFRCERTLALCRMILASSVESGPPIAWFDGDNLFAACRDRGLPIGNLTSQLWANFYLDRLDHFVLEVLRAPGYARYTDDFLLWADDKMFLHASRDRIAAELVKDRLTLHAGKTRVLPTADGVPFLGFRFRPGRRPRVLGEAKRRFERRMRRMTRALCEGRVSSATRCASAVGWKAFADYGNTTGLYHRYRQGGFGMIGRMSGGSFGAWRGASWNNNNPDNLRCDYRNDNNGTNRDNNNGFRLVLSAR